MSNKAHHIRPSEAIQREQALEYVDVLLTLSQMPVCQVPGCGKGIAWRMQVDTEHYVAMPCQHPISVPEEAR